MIRDVLGNMLQEYGPADALEQESVLQELMQHYVLASLSRGRLFAAATFHGGTCLRILYGMNRFSEDLDFLLREPDPSFEWAPYLDRLRRDCRAEGIHFEVQDRARAGMAVKKAFLKTDSIGQVLDLELPYARHASRKIRIKLEVDTNPPAGATVETRYISFPVTAAITSMDLPSGFGSKAHALLCREYTKGRDWYDFLWYASRKVVPNYALLGNALAQQGPWAGRRPDVTPEWFIATLRERIEGIDWQDARSDVQRFVMANEQPSLDLWTKDLFLHHLERLEEALREQG